MESKNLKKTKTRTQILIRLTEIVSILLSNKSSKTDALLDEATQLNEGLVSMGHEKINLNNLKDNILNG